MSAKVLNINRELGENTLIGISRVPCCLKASQDNLHIGRFVENLRQRQVSPEGRHKDSTHGPWI